MYLAEAVKLKSIIRKKIHELNDERERVAYSEIVQGSELPEQPRTLATVEAELLQTRRDFEKLDALMYRANIDHTITFQHETLSIVEAIERATQLRAEAETCKTFAAASQEEFMYGYGSDTYPVVRVARFDPEQYRQRAIQLEKDAHTLSNLINAKNYAITIPFDDTTYFTSLT